MSNGSEMSQELQASMPSAPESSVKSESSGTSPNKDHGGPRNITDNDDAYPSRSSSINGKAAQGMIFFVLKIQRKCVLQAC